MAIAVTALEFETSISSLHPDLLQLQKNKINVVANKIVQYVIYLVLVLKSNQRTLPSSPQLRKVCGSFGIVTTS